MGSFFKGWTDTLPHIEYQQPFVDTTDFFLGQVINVDYTVPGKINVRVLGVNKELKDEDVKTVAYPIDLSILRLPIPGELVLLIQGINAKGYDEQLNMEYLYTTVFTNNRSITTNSDPYVATPVPSKLALDTFTTDYAERFINTMISPQSFVNTITSKPKNKTPLKPVEGDVIIQNRFGGGVRLSSSGKEGESPWSKASAPSNPITLITVNNAEEDTPALEDINKDRSSIYIASKNSVEINMATSKGLKTHQRRYNLSKFDIAIEKSSFLSTEYHPGVALAGGTFAFGKGNKTPSTAFGITDPNVQASYTLVVQREGLTTDVTWDISNWRTGHGSSTLHPSETMVLGITPMKLNNDYTKWPCGWVNNVSAYPSNPSAQLIYADIGKADVNPINIYGQDHSGYNPDHGLPHGISGRLWSADMKQDPLKLIAKYPGYNTLCTQRSADADVLRHIIEALDGIKAACKEYFKADGNAVLQSVGPGGAAALVSVTYNHGNSYSAKSWKSVSGSPLGGAVSGGQQGLYNVLMGPVCQKMKNADRHRAEAAFIMNPVYS